MLCEYGCGNEAKFLLNKSKNKKWCCSDSYHKCPAIIRKRPILQKKNIYERFLSAIEKTIIKEAEDSIVKARKIYNVDLEDECWIWKKYKDRDGYGVSSDETGYPIQAHRLSFKLFKEDIPKGMVICHYCDNPPCVNPNHLFLNTVNGNNKDRVYKERSAFGEKNGMYTKPETRSYGNEKASYLWEVIDPDGNKLIIKNLMKFCRDKNIPFTRVRCSLKGWKTILLQKFVERK